MIKKLFMGIFLGILGFGAVYLYFIYIGDTSILRNRIHTYQIYTAIFFVSLVAIYMLQGGNKIFRFLMFMIVVINLFILGDVFFRNNIGLNSGQFLILFGLFLVALAVTYINHRIRYVLMLIIGICIVLVLLTGILPLYEKIPSITDFIQGQKTRIINPGIASEGTLVIKNDLGTKELPVSEVNGNDIDLSQKTQISFISKTKTGLEKIFIDLGNGSFININPQSAIILEQSGDNTIMQILQGDIQYYTPPEFSGALEIIGKYKGKYIQNIQNTVRSTIKNQFEQKKEDFFINEIGGTMMLHPVINNIIKFFITTLYKISPKIYQENLINYTTMQQFFGKYITGTNNPINTGENIRSMFDDIMSQVKKGAEETTIINKRLQ